MNELRLRALNGDLVAENELFSLLRVRFVLLAKRRVGERDAEDIAQDACVTIAEKFRSLSPDTNFAAWAFQVLRNKIGNRLQLRGRRDETDVEQCPDLAGPSSSAELEQSVMECLRRVYQVNPSYARAINLVHLGYSVEDICRLLKVTRGNLYVLLSRGRTQLRKCLAE